MRNIKLLTFLFFLSQFLFSQEREKIDGVAAVIGDFVVLVNAKKIEVTGNKAENKIYYRHTGYPGGIKKISFKDQLDKDPEKLIRDAVKGMLPKNRLNRQIIKKLKVYNDENHPHEAQNPEVIK